MNISPQRLGVIEPLYEEHFLAQAAQRFEHLPELHGFPFTGSPPLLAVKTIPREEHPEARRRFARGPACHSIVSPYGKRFHPRQGDGHTDPAQEGPSIE